MGSVPHLLASITSHGFGHAAQTAPVINRLRRLRPDLRVTLRTDLPLGFLASRFDGHFNVVPGPGDFGLAMESALAIAHERSAAHYASFHAEWDVHVQNEAEIMRRLDVDLVLANISYLVLAAAQAAGIPAAALCSFNWALIYGHYFGDRPEAAEVLAHMETGYGAAARTLVLEPSMALAGYPGYTPVGVVARRGGAIGSALRAHLGIGAETRLVALSLGGVDARLDPAAWPRHPDLHWLMPRLICPRRPDMSAQENIPWAFTDQLAACDAFVTKAGYGSFTEAACNGVPVLYISRPEWPEESSLVTWMRQHGVLRPVTASGLARGDILADLEELWSLPRLVPVVPRGAEAAAHAIANLL